ncbi:MAG: hypothetical protein PVH91_11995 [Pseudomonadales bacterium]|jgi:hypothetical protein
MHCSELEKSLDDYLDGRVDEDSPIALHVRGCATCGQALERRRGLIRDLRRLPLPEPDPDFLARSIANAEAANGRGRLPAGMRLAGLAAVLAAALLLAVLVVRQGYAPETGLPEIYLATDTVTPVKLAFSSEKPLRDARLTLTLPVGVALDGYGDRTDLSWRTDLKAGTNVLRLPLIGHGPASDLLIARLDHETGSKTFRLHVTVNDSGAPDHE